MEWLLVGAVAVVVPPLVMGVVWLGVLLVRWARGNPGGASAGAIGLFLEDKLGSIGDWTQGGWDGLRTWLGDQVDGVGQSDGDAGSCDTDATSDCSGDISASSSGES